MQIIPAFSSEIKVENKSISILTESVFALQAAMITDTSPPTINYNHLSISNTYYSKTITVFVCLGCFECDLQFPRYKFERVVDKIMYAPFVATIHVPESLF